MSAWRSQHLSDAKRAKLVELSRFRHGLPYASQTALAAITGAGHRGELPENYKRQDQLLARKVQMTTVGPFGALEHTVQLHSVPPFAPETLRIVSPHAFLHTAFVNGGGFRDFLLRRHAQTPSSPERPWGLVLYCDEMDPGNALSPVHTRNAWMWYYSFWEYGPLALSSEDMWYTISCKRADSVKKVQDGVSQIAASLLKFVFKGPHDPRTVGIYLGQITLYVTLKGFLMDGDAHKKVWGLFGSSGFRLCILCANLWSRRSRIDEEDGTEGLVCTITEPTRLIAATNAQLYATADRLSRKALTDEAHIFELRERAAGMHNFPRGLLQDLDLRDLVYPVDMYIHDPQHTLFVDGVVNACIYLVLEWIYHDASQGPNTQFKDIHVVVHGFTSSWRWPGGLTSHAPDMFNPTRVAAWRKAKHVKASASDILSIYPVLAYFLRTCRALSDGRCELQISAFLLMAEMVDAFLLVPFGATTPEAVQLKVRSFLRACVAADWEEYMKPKFHWLVHLVGHLLCFALERKHKVPKKHAREMKNTRVFEEAVLGEVTCEHLCVLEDPEFGSSRVGLLDKHAAPVALAQYLCDSEPWLQNMAGLTNDDFKAGHQSRHGLHGVSRKGDIVLLNNGGAWACGEVRAHLEIADEPVTIVSLFDPIVFSAERRFAKWAPRDNNLQLWPTSDIRCACVYRRYTDCVVTLLPPYVR